MNILRVSISLSMIPEAEVLSVADHSTLRWLKLQQLTYRDAHGRMKKWERAIRTTRPPGGDCDAVQVVALLREGSAKPAELLLVRQFRPAVGSYTIELPAGLVDIDETCEAAALRELKEETGYHGEVRGVSPLITMSPGAICENVKMVTVDVDLMDPRNAAPKQGGEEEGTIQVHRVKIAELMERLGELSGGGCLVVEGLYCLAYGMTML